MRTYREQLTHVANQLIDLAEMCPRHTQRGAPSCALCDPWWDMASALTVLAAEELRKEVEANGLS